MAKLPNIDWSRLGAEAVVIIVSVLAALALDDWRDARADRELEHHLIVSLKEDLTADLDELDSVLKSAKAVEQASSFLLGKSDGYVAEEFGPAGLGLSRLVEQSPDAIQATPQEVAVRAIAGGIDFDLSDLTF